jgi:acyl carrier protein
MPRVTKEDLKQLLLERDLFSSIAGELDDDTEIVLDSLALLWFLEGLEKRLIPGVQWADEDYAKFRSINEIYRLIEEKAGGSGD